MNRWLIVMLACSLGLCVTAAACGDNDDDDDSSPTDSGLDGDTASDSIQTEMDSGTDSSAGVVAHCEIPGDSVCVEFLNDFHYDGYRQMCENASGTFLDGGACSPVDTIGCCLLDPTYKYFYYTGESTGDPAELETWCNEAHGIWGDC